MPFYAHDGQKIATNRRKSRFTSGLSVAFRCIPTVWERLCCPFQQKKPQFFPFSAGWRYFFRFCQRFFRNPGLFLSIFSIFHTILLKNGENSRLWRHGECYMSPKSSSTALPKPTFLQWKPVTFLAVAN